MSMEVNLVTKKIIDCAIDVHKELGCGFSEDVYQSALGIEMNKKGLSFIEECELPISYKGEQLEVRFKCDFLVEQKVIIECKVVEALNEIDTAELLNHLKIKNLKVGLIINFNVLKLKDGIKRLTNNYQKNSVLSAFSAKKNEQRNI